MTSEQWKVHMELSEGLVRPSKGSSVDEWRIACQAHVYSECSICKARAKQRIMNKHKRERNAVLADKPISVDVRKQLLDIVNSEFNSQSTCYDLDGEALVILREVLGNGVLPTITKQELGANLLPPPK